jgi:hypothetical protein
MSSEKTSFISRTGTSSTVYPIKEVIGSKDFVAWKNECSREIRNEIYQGYIDYLVNPAGVRTGLNFEQKGGSGAMMVKQITSDSSVDQAIFLQGYITEILAENGYVINLTEEKQHENQETSLIVYVKPSFKLPQLGDKSDQLFGNIHMEIRFNNTELQYFKVIAHRYNDFRFDKGRSFAELMELLFKS